MQFTPPPPGSKGLIRWTTNVNKCLEVAGGSTKEGTNIQLGDCDGSKTSMLFTMPSGGAGQIRWTAHPDKCIDVDNGSTNDGTNLQLWPCLSVSPWQANQQWQACDASPLPPVPTPTPPPSTSALNEPAAPSTTTPTAAASTTTTTAAPSTTAPTTTAGPVPTQIPSCSGPLRWSTHSDKCVDVAAGKTAVGTNIQLWYCDNDAEHPNMQFTPPPPGSQGLIRWTTNVNKCLEVAGGSTKEGTNIQLGDCDGSKTSMLFTMPSGGAGQIRWTAHLDKCIDVDNGSSKDGTNLQLWPCLSVSPWQSNQQWQTCDASPLPPVPTPTLSPTPTPVVPVVPGAAIGWRSEGTAGNGWCQGQRPEPGWGLRGTCPSGQNLKVKALTYNLFWWNLFGQRRGNGGSAGKLIASSQASQAFDVMGFQECDDVNRVLADAGLQNDYGSVNGGHAIAIAWRKSSWELLASGKGDVNEDQRSQYYGNRAAQWVRLRHTQNGQTLFFVNHHGPLPVNSGGQCGGEATAFNMLRMIGSNAFQGDLIILVGDFNSQANTQTTTALEGYMHRVYTGSSFGGVDHIFSNCDETAMYSAVNLGAGGSDHEALSAGFQV
ncbi:unnamed protein product [Polarella glacialis]|uniref:Ricin B lectin domain-containing protein n=1 Tax=Polarella glacialis TaxID=89957 RepID=A0A813DRP8_POLGL|nr:unnamed protein product [Polarella glacialis]